MAKTIVDKLTDVSAERMGTIMETEKPNVADYGHIPETQTSPNTAKNAIVGALVGMILSIGVILVIYLMNDAIQTTEDVERYLREEPVDMIKMLPEFAKRRKKQENKLRRKSNMVV